jgi:hypothetical protein
MWFLRMSLGRCFSVASIVGIFSTSCSDFSTNSGTSEAVAGGGASGITAYVVAEHQATEHQRLIAEQSAKLALTKASAAQKQDYNKERYIAVDTVREKGDVGAESVMVYDTYTHEVVGKEEYDLRRPLKEGAKTKFDAYSAEYVGTGK